MRVEPASAPAPAPAPLGYWSRVLQVLRQVSGMPDYQRYLAHMQERHAGCPVPSEKEYYDQYVNGRYGNGASRCC